ncbi:MAG: RdgB/HAM1 family non-canonical purine NTP pyrophosphatase [Flavobacteriales bacterium]|nr:RdgB/HAM1 family non-canonical purine NTP pyrophosphatase [Flavobacteriales bacterium]
MRILLCTGNAGKVAELLALMPPGMEVISLAEAGLAADLPETGDTLIANALQKARFAHARTGLTCLADDTGLEVAALDGAPGVHSARYAGEDKDAAANVRKLLGALQGVVDRRACFRTVMAWVAADEERTFEGTVEGIITHAPRGEGGFGYDPVFQPLGEAHTFAEMDLRAKNALSHRARAMHAVQAFLSDRSAVR